MIKDNVEIIRCKDKKEASKKALELLLKTVDKDTLLFLSGGTSPDLLYQLIARDKKLRPGAIALIDERYGLPMHENSNEKMITDTGLVGYINNEGIAFYGVLKAGDMEKATDQYEQIVRDLFKKYSKKIAVMGIGADGHTAGIKPGLDYDHSRCVIAYNDINGHFGKRITLTLEALNEVNEFIILIFGEDKRGAFEKMFKEQNQVKLPAVFFTKTSARVTLLTDINLDS